jgi:phospholipid/cholesterol/gamma-HCH transport system substrate-binding protein
MDRKKSKSLITGAIAIISIVLIIWGLNYLKKQSLFESNKVYYTEFDNIQGLSLSSIVTINGFQVGNIIEIKIREKENKGHLIVKYNYTKDLVFSKNTIVKIKPALMGSSELIIVPNYEGEEAISGTHLKGSLEKGMLSALTEKLGPMEGRFNEVLSSLDQLLVNVNNTLDINTQKNIQASVAKLNAILSSFKNTSKSVENLVADNKTKFNTIISNATTASENLKSITAEFEKADLTANLKQTMLKLNSSLSNFDAILAKVNKGEGSIGKLMKDEGLYNNLENAAKEMEELLREMKEHPKRFVHFSLFGKKDKRGYVKDTVN